MVKSVKLISLPLPPPKLHRYRSARTRRWGGVTVSKKVTFSKV